MFEVPNEFIEELQQILATYPCGTSDEFISSASILIRKQTDSHSNMDLIILYQFILKNQEIIIENQRFKNYKKEIVASAKRLIPQVEAGRNTPDWMKALCIGLLEQSINIFECTQMEE